jgi:hypothetical protein
VSHLSPNEPPYNLVYVDGLAPRLTRGGYGYVGKQSFSPAAYTVSAAGVPTIGTGVTGTTPFSQWGVGPYSVPVEMSVLVATSARLPLAHATKGLELQPNAINNDTVEYVIGGNKTTNPYAHVVGTTPPSFFSVTLEQTDADGCDQLVVGWRIVQAFNAAGNGFITGVDPGYTDFAAMGFAGAIANPNPMRVITDLNDTGTPTISLAGFTWADTLVHKLEVRVVGRKALFLLNGALLGASIRKDALGNSITAQQTTTPPTYSFDTGDTLVPFIYIRNDTNIGEGIYLAELEVGRLTDIGLDNNNRGAIVQ